MRVRRGRRRSKRRIGGRGRVRERNRTETGRKEGERRGRRGMEGERSDIGWREEGDRGGVWEGRKWEREGFLPHWRGHIPRQHTQHGMPYTTTCLLASVLNT